MKLDVFDTYITLDNGQVMHFDVLMPQGSAREQALVHALQWLESIAVEVNNLRIDKCRFCHTEEASPRVAAEIAAQGFSILQLEGCPLPVR